MTPADTDDQTLFAVLDRLSIAWRTIEHPAIMTVAEGRAYKASMPGGHSKNLFLKDKKGALFLVSAHCDTPVDLVGLGRALGARGRLSFAGADAMMETLGVAPGSVTPFGLAHPGARSLRAFVVDTAFLTFETLWFHPLRNTASTAISTPSLLLFARHFGFDPVLLDAARPVPAG